MIGIKNLTGQKIKSRYDGEDYVFEADEKVTTPLSEDAARHIFGYGERDKQRALLRLGWIANGANVEAAQERLSKVQFLAGEVKFGEEPKEATLHLPRKVAEGRGIETPLSADEQKIAQTMAHQEGATKQFAKK